MHRYVFLPFFFQQPRTHLEFHRVANVLIQSFVLVADVILANQPTKEKDSESESQNVLLDQLFKQFWIVQRILDAWEKNEVEE